MICCKVVTDFNQGDFSKLFEMLNKKGCLLWAKNCLFFASEEAEITKKTVEKILKKSDYTDYYIQEFKRIIDCQDEHYIKGFVCDHVTKITIKSAENLQQKEFRELADKLDEFNKDLNDQLKEIQDSDQQEG